MRSSPPTSHHTFLVLITAAAVAGSLLTPTATATATATSTAVTSTSTAAAPVNDVVSTAVRSGNDDAATLAAARRAYDAALTAANLAITHAKGKTTVGVERLRGTIAYVTPRIDQDGVSLVAVESYTRWLTESTAVVTKAIRASAAEKKQKATFTVAYNKVRTTATAVVATAKGKVSSQSLRTTMSTTRKAVVAASSTSWQVAGATRELRGAVRTTNDRIATWKRWKSQHSGWTSTFRKQIDTLAGRHIRLEYDSYTACGALACASKTTIWLNKALTAKSAKFRTWAVYHEVAHVKQFAVGMGALRSSKTFASLFDGDIELLANCMARGKGIAPVSGLTCSSAQIAFGRSVWSGKLPK